MGNNGYRDRKGKEKIFHSAYPIGEITRVEAREVQLDYVTQDKDIKTIMIDIDDADLLVKEGMDSTCFGTDKVVITTTTINDDVLPAYYIEKEAQIVKDFKPDFHIPCDKPVYLTQPRNERLFNIQEQVESVLELKGVLSDSNTRLIPLIKGVEDDEIISSYSILRQHGFQAFAYYGSQYFGNGRGSHSDELINDVGHIVRLFGLGYLMLIGVQSDTIRRKLPEEVKAYASLRRVRDSCWHDITRRKKKQTTLIDFQLSIQPEARAPGLSNPVTNEFSEEQRRY